MVLRVIIIRLRLVHVHRRLLSTLVVVILSILLQLLTAAVGLQSQLSLQLAREPALLLSLCGPATPLEARPRVQEADAAVTDPPGQSVRRVHLERHNVGEREREEEEGVLVSHFHRENFL